MGRGRSGLGRGAVELGLAAIAVAVAIQSWAHLELALGEHHLDSILDLDRSNGLPDLASTFAIGMAGAGAALWAFREIGGRRALAAGAACALTLLTLADLLHDGAHPTRPGGPLVIGLVCGAAVLVGFIALRSSWSTRIMLFVGAGAMTVSFLITGLDRYDQRFERERGDPIREYQIVAKEDLELVGWSLVALALWSEALRLAPRRARSGDS